LCQTRLPHSPRLAGLKHLSRLEQVLASAELPAHCQEGLMLDVSGRLIEGTTSNLFLVLDDQLLTPRLDNCGVAGVVRRQILEYCAQWGIAAAERPLTLEQLYRAGEVFLTSSLSGIRPVVRVGCVGKEIGAVTQRLQQAFEHIWF
jgi:4-amino-4-deoxychorismate lyase